MIPIKVFGKVLIGIVVIFFIYLAIALAWASLSVEYLLNEEAVVSESPLLNHKQKEILLKIEDPTFYDHVGIDLSQGQGLM